MPGLGLMGLSVTPKPNYVTVVNKVDALDHAMFALTQEKMFNQVMPHLHVSTRHNLGGHASKHHSSNMFKLLVWSGSWFALAFGLAFDLVWLLVWGPEL